VSNLLHKEKEKKSEDQWLVEFISWNASLGWYSNRKIRNLLLWR